MKESLIIKWHVWKMDDRSAPYEDHLETLQELAREDIFSALSEGETSGELFGRLRLEEHDCRAVYCGHWYCEEGSELQDELEATQHQRDKVLRDYEQAMHRVAQLEAEVTKMAKALQPFAAAWRRRVPSDRCPIRVRARRMARALSGFYSVTGRDDDEPHVLTGQHLKDADDVLSYSTMDVHQ